MKCKNCKNSVTIHYKEQLCNTCHGQAYYKKHKKQYYARSSGWSEIHRDYYKQNSSAYYQIHKKDIIIKAVEKYRANPTKARRRRRAQYNKHREKRRTSHRDYYNTGNGKECILRSLAKRNRNFSWIKLMDNPFPKDVPIHWHHLNNIFVVPVPSVLHLGGSTAELHRRKVSDLMKRIGFEYDNIIVEVT
jgi:hypothetical protein